MIVEFTFHKKQNVETMFILNESQNVPHGKLDKINILKYGLGDQPKT
jgi:hypothetical protein